MLGEYLKRRQEELNRRFKNGGWICDNCGTINAKSESIFSEKKISKKYWCASCFKVFTISEVGNFFKNRAKNKDNTLSTG